MGRPVTLTAEQINRKVPNKHKQAFASESSYGLTKHEYYVGLAMQALISSSNYTSDSDLAVTSIKIADEVLKHLEE